MARYIGYFEELRTTGTRYHFVGPLYTEDGGVAKSLHAGDELELRYRRDEGGRGLNVRIRTVELLENGQFAFTVLPGEAW